MTSTIIFLLYNRNYNHNHYIQGCRDVAHNTMPTGAVASILSFDCDTTEVLLHIPGA